MGAFYVKMWREAEVAKLADAYGLGPYGFKNPWRFKSSPRHQDMKIKIRKKTIIIGILIITVVFILVSVVSKNNRPVEVEITKAAVQDIVKTISLSGKIKADNQVDLSFATSGTINSIAVELNSSVKENDTLAVLNTAVLYNTYLAQKSLYDKAKQQLETFIETYNDDPDTAGINSEDIYWSKYKEYDDAVISSKASSDAALNGLSNAYIKSPINGIVTESNYKKEEYAAVGSKVIQVTDPNTLYFGVSAAQEDIGQIKLEQEVKIELDTYPNISLKGSVYYISPVPTTDASGNSVYEVKVKIGNEENIPEIKLGMEGSASVILENKISRLSIDSSAITEIGDLKYVFVDKNGVAKRIDIKTDFEGDVLIEIIEGLKEGDNVILSPLSRVKDGKKVTENAN